MIAVMLIASPRTHPGRSTDPRHVVKSVENKFCKILLQILLARRI